MCRQLVHGRASRTAVVVIVPHTSFADLLCGTTIQTVRRSRRTLGNRSKERSRPSRPHAPDREEDCAESRRVKLGAHATPELLRAHSPPQRPLTHIASAQQTSQRLEQGLGHDVICPESRATAADWARSVGTPAIVIGLLSRSSSRTSSSFPSSRTTSSLPSMLLVLAAWMSTSAALRSISIETANCS